MLKQILFLFLIGTVTSIATASEDVTNSNDNQNIFQKGNIKIEVRSQDVQITFISLIPFCIKFMELFNSKFRS